LIDIHFVRVDSDFGGYATIVSIVGINSGLTSFEHSPLY